MLPALPAECDRHAELRTPELADLREATRTDGASISHAESAVAWARFLRLRCAVGAGHGFAVRVRLTSSHGVRGCRREVRNDGHDPRAGARAGSAGGGACTCLVFGLAASTSASTWSCSPHSAGDKGTGARCRHGQAEVFNSWCISSACGSSVQVSSKDRWRFSTWQKTDNTGGTSGCEQRLGSSITRSGRPATGVLRGCVR